MCDDALLPERTRRGRPAKRILDVAVGLPLCLIAIPVLVVLAVALWIQMRAGPLFVHDRVGKDGRRLVMPKLRTLPPSTPPYADKTVDMLEPASSLAKALRETHLDELPQLLLVPAGRMSLVGPRPRMPIELELCRDDRYEHVRTLLDQGCTGLWQISVANSRRISDDPRYDYFYVHHRTIRLDLWILWRTFVQLLGARPIELHQVPAWALSRGAPDPATAACHLAPSGEVPSDRFGAALGGGLDPVPQLAREPSA